VPRRAAFAQPTDLKLAGRIADFDAALTALERMAAGGRTHGFIVCMSKIMWIKHSVKL
jgi:hypothetical protein